MKYRRIIVSTFVLALVVFSSPVFAEEGGVGVSGQGSTTPLKVRADVRANIEVKRASTTERVQERKVSSTERRVEFQQNIAKRQVEHVTKVMLATIERLEKIIVRIESRIAKIKAEGGATTEAESFVADAKLNLSDAKASVSAFASIELSSDKARDNFEKVRTMAAGAREHIRLAHENLMKAVRSLGRAKDSTETDSSAE